MADDVVKVADTPAGAGGDALLTVREDAFRGIVFYGSRSAVVPPLPAVRVNRRLAARAADGSLSPDVTAFFERLCAMHGLRASHYRASILQRRLSACLRALRASTAVDGAHAIERSEADADRALGALMIGVTGFFRDSHVFDALRQNLTSLRARAGRLRAMSVACSDGSELYSLAMLLAEEDMLGGAKLTGMDCRRGAIDAARAGMFSAASAQTIPAPLRARYFTTVAAPPLRAIRQSEPMLRVRDDVRSACRWIVADVFTAPYDEVPQQDIIMCRNLAIYLAADAAATLWTTLASRLRPGGLLVVGKAERPCNVGRALERVAPCLFRRRTDS